ncbi:HAD family hydrolase [[Limnothrix rosea] IAM M-220]|uniref:HAD family hydrolase n=1 Tax=[Limnothrix rosea] IAM M-220 TaxID=454133 RepID=UPI000959F425|nr:HAD family hydrolase [[Limnothrix rosea] IAM M-220]OKH11501.1 hypothetical protein NIES208_17235 [[Limnothrix rosea] IAM M-220]
MNFDLDPHLDSLAETSLAQLRRPTTLPLPEKQFVDYSPVSMAGDRQIWETFLQSSSCPFQQEIPELAGKVAVFDLDETILMNSFISPEIWELGDGYTDKTIVPAFYYSMLQSSLKGRFQKLLGRTHYDTKNTKRHPFLQQPRHIVMCRPGMLYGLNWLKNQGVVLILATASARERVQYLSHRFAMFREIFEDRIITANEIAYFYGQNREMSEISMVEKNILLQRPQSLAAKVPAIFNFFLKINDYDVLVDDSQTTTKIFKNTPLTEKLLPIKSDQAVSSYGLKIIIKTVERLLGRSLNTSIKNHGSQQQPWRDIITRVEDPYYWPLCHMSDQLKLND